MTLEMNSYVIVNIFDDVNLYYFLLFEKSLRNRLDSELDNMSEITVQIWQMKNNQLEFFQCFIKLGYFLTAMGNTCKRI